jgi:hypothetical protein
MHYKLKINNTNTKTPIGITTLSDKLLTDIEIITEANEGHEERDDSILYTSFLLFFIEYNHVRKQNIIKLFCSL